MTKTLPKYYEKYFDEKFDHVNQRFDGVNKRLDKQNGQIEKNKTNIGRLATGVLVGSAVLIKESRDAIIGVLASLFGL